MKNTFRKKLVLGKKEVIELTDDKMKNVYGGDGTIYPCNPNSGWCGYTTCFSTVNPSCR